MVRHVTCRHNYAVERGRVVGFCGQPLYCNRPYYPQPGFDLPRHTWSLLNHFRTGQGPCRAHLHNWGLVQSPCCDCGQRQTMNHIVNTCPLTKFKGRLKLLHEVDDDTVIWLESMAASYSSTNNLSVCTSATYILLKNLLHNSESVNRV